MAWERGVFSEDCLSGLMARAFFFFPVKHWKPLSDSLCCQHPHHSTEQVTALSVHWIGGKKKRKIWRPAFLGNGSHFHKGILVQKFLLSRFVIDKPS